MFIIGFHLPHYLILFIFCTGLQILSFLPPLQFFGSYLFFSDSKDLQSFLSGYELVVLFANFFFQYFCCPISLNVCQSLDAHSSFLGHVVSRR